MSELGEFALKLGIKTDQDAFEKASRSIDKVTTNVSRLLGVVKAAATVKTALTGFDLIKLESSSLHVASALGISTRALESWKVAAKIAGVNTSGLIQGMDTLDQKFRSIKRGIAPDESLVKNLNLMGLNYLDLMDMEADDRTRMILKKALGMKDSKLAQDYVRDILGPAAADFFRAVKDGKQTLDERLLSAANMVYTTPESKSKALGFVEEANTVFAQLSGLSSLAGSELGGALTPLLENVNKFFKDNGADIAQKITGFANGLGTLVPVVSKFAGESIKTGVKLVGDLAGAVTSLLTGDWEKTGENLKKFFQDLNGGIGTLMGATSTDVLVEKTEQVTNTFFDKEATLGQKVASLFSLGVAQAGYMFNILSGKDEDYNNMKALEANMKSVSPKYLLGGSKGQKLSDYAPELQTQIIDALNNNPIAEGMIGYLVTDLYKSHFNSKNPAGQRFIKDGIIRPNGQVTQVAPDDWVFAARNIGDMAAAFIPHNLKTPAQTAITINQSFTIDSKSGIPLPQTIKEAAFDGTKSALDVIINSANRLQLMPGLR